MLRIFAVLMLIARVAQAQEHDAVAAAAPTAIVAANPIVRGPFAIPRGRDQVDVAFIVKGDAVDPAQFHCRVTSGDDNAVSDKAAFAVPSFIAEQARSESQREQSAATLIKFVGLPRAPGHDNTYAIVDSDGKIIATTPTLRAPASTESFSFLVYGDMREAHHSDERPEFYVQDDSVMPPTFAALTRYLDSVKKSPPRFQLLTGDLMNKGGDTQQWDEFLSFADPVWRRAPIISAMGNHEGQGAHREKKFVSNFGNLFYFDAATAAPLHFAEQAALMQRAFDIGGVRFVNFPVIQELAEVDYLYGQRAMPDELVAQFLSSLHDAAEAKKRGEIQFIIVYSHIPLIGSPMLRLDHRGLGQVIERAKRSGEQALTEKYAKFLLAEFHPDDPAKLDRVRAAAARAAALDVGIIAATEKIADALVADGVDAWMNGHNHLYQRLAWNKIPLVTVGIGTELDNRAPTNAPNKTYETVLGAKVTTERHLDAERSTRGKIPYDKKIPPAKRPGELIGFLRCNVEPRVKKRAITCELLGTRYHVPPDAGEFDEDGAKSADSTYDDLPKLEVLDKFVIKSRAPK